MAAALDNQPEQARSEERGRRMKWVGERARIGMERQPGCSTGWSQEWGAKPKSGLAWRCLGRSYDWSVERATEVPLALVVGPHRVRRHESTPVDRAHLQPYESTLNASFAAHFPALPRRRTSVRFRSTTRGDQCVGGSPETFPSCSPGLQDDRGDRRTSSWIGDSADDERYRAFEGCCSVSHWGVVIGVGEEARSVVRYLIDTLGWWSRIRLFCAFRKLVLFYGVYFPDFFPFMTCSSFVGVLMRA